MGNREWGIGIWSSEMARPHESLQAWKEAMRLVRIIYDLTNTFPREEIYGLVAQMRRAAVSVPSNLAEGAARASRKEFSQFLSVAKGSLSELETQLLISADLGYWIEAMEYSIWLN